MQPEVDRDIIERVVEGNHKAFNSLMNVYKSRVYYLCLKLLQVNEEAEEVAQDVFIKLFRELKKFKGDSKLSTWIFRITYNECISKIRKTRKYREQKDVEGYDLVFIEKSYENIEHQQKSKMLELALDELDAKSKTIVLMFYYHDKSIEEIAEITNLTKENIKIRLFRARKRLLYVIEKKFKLDKTDWI